jgi:hypothetical protein
MENETTPNNTPAAQAPVSAKPENGSAGPVIGTFIILAVIVIGGLYFWSQRSTDSSLINQDQVDQNVESINTQSDSDDLSSIEADLDATDVDGLDTELNAGQ